MSAQRYKKSQKWPLHKLTSLKIGKNNNYLKNIYTYIYIYIKYKTPNYHSLSYFFFNFIFNIFFFNGIED